ncbi:MAG: NAD(P)H-binding protein [Mycobacteriaceae bacterium]|nr:NAD(P)H-binding protein [Mycobacteriaceae bacterium]
MKIAVVGATGMVGTRVVAEAAHRGHAVVAVSRHGRASDAPGVTAASGDAADTARMSALFGAVDAVVAATRPAPGAEHLIAPTTTALLSAAAAAGVRVLVVGGAGALRTPGDPDQLVLDSPYVPAEIRPIAAAGVAQLAACRDHGGDWVYLSPPAMLEPGRRTGTYRRGGDTLITEADGESRISAEDFAVAILDELENPSDIDHFTVARRP